jgi:hypothetical protein
MSNDPAFAQFVPPSTTGGPTRTEITGYSSSSNRFTTWDNTGAALDTLLAELDDVLTIRGRARIALARLIAERHRAALPNALTIARDLLEYESDEHCETVFVLLRGGWNDSLGALLHTAHGLDDSIC